MENSVFEQFDQGSSAPWNAHPKFAGVFLKTTITPEQAGAGFSCLLVRIEPGQAIGLHTHPDSVELHEVIKGSGLCRMEHGDMPYVPGTAAVIAANAPHEVLAGDDGLYLFAKFINV